MNNASNDFAIDLQNVSRYFGEHIAVHDLTLQLPKGSITGLIGLNGAGKSTLIRLAVGLLAPHKGSLRVAGCDVKKDPVELRHRIGYVPDRPNVYSWMTVKDAIRFVESFHQFWDVDRCNDLLNRLKLPLEKKVKHLSKGQAAKLQLLLAICHDPQVLILDEPTSGFDPIVREEFLEGVLQTASNSGQTVLISSHALSDVQRLADRIAIMHEGKLILGGTTDDLLSRVKRVRIITDQSRDRLALPNGTLRNQISGREWVLTLDSVNEDKLELIKCSSLVDQVEVMDLNLDDIFKDVIRGKEEVNV